MAGKRGPDLTERIHDAGDDDHEHAEHQQRGEHLADDADQTRLTNGKRKHHREEQRGKRQHVHRIAEQRDHRHLVGGGGRTRLGDDHAGAQDDGGVEHQPRHSPQRTLDGYVSTTCSIEREDAQTGKRHIDQDEAQKADYPIGSAFHAQKRRENKVPGTEEHGEQGQSCDQSVFLQECSFMELRPKCLL